MDNLWKVFRSHWPTTRKNSKRAVEDDDYPLPDEASELPPSSSSEDLQPGSPDIDLAKALGVPKECVERMTPRKDSEQRVQEQASASAPGHLEKTQDQIREERIAILQTLDLIAPSLFAWSM